MNNIDYTHVIVLDDATWTVFGTGRDNASALIDAAQWAEGDLNGLRCFRATEAAYEYAKAHGGDCRVSALNISERPYHISLASRSNGTGVAPW